MIGSEKVPRRRSETRKRLIAAAGELLVEHGIHKASIEEICERAGFTRGAFYSNFESVDELLFALYEWNIELYLERLEEVLSSTAATPDVGEIVGKVLNLLQVGSHWQLLNAEFTAQALRNPLAAAALSEHRRRLRERLEPILLSAIERAGRKPTVPISVLIRVVMAAHEGAMTHSHFPDPGAPEPADLSPLTLQCILSALTTPDRQPASK
ncbi:MAG: TetR/AcrR family transcriptional regulator [Renibacterium salmoninarum]|nr:TetR/AcrR family transcriptional regulator [Renibacterium sp.]MDN5667762.1 TetR/AcrR family transcriptional regulator [Renibacterium salmoninarum]